MACCQDLKKPMQPNVRRQPVPAPLPAATAAMAGTRPATLKAPPRSAQPVLRGLNSQQIVDGESVFRLYTVYTNAGSDMDAAYANLQM